MTNFDLYHGLLMVISLILGGVGFLFWHRYKEAYKHSKETESTLSLLQKQVQERALDHEHIAKTLEETLIVAESANRVKKDFIANMSHEIRTPMNAITGFTDLALQDEMSPQVRRYLSKVAESSHALMGLINDILDYSKIEECRVKSDPVTFDLHDLFDRLGTLFGQRVNDKGIELILSLPPTFNQILYGDVRRLEQVLIHLIRNSIKFTQQGMIVVQCTMHQQSKTEVLATFSVSDTGIGFDPTLLPQLFEPFIQADTTSTRHYGGTGLGLAICKNLSTLLNGTLSAESIPDKGTLFSLQVPFESRGKSNKPHIQLPPHLHNKKVLLVEDCLVTQKMLHTLVQALSLHVDRVASGEEALDQLFSEVSPQNAYDLLIMDWILPGLDGIQTTQQITQKMLTSPNPGKVPLVILMTSSGKEEVRQQAQDVGVAAFIRKPISQTQLFHVIMSVFGQTMTVEHQPSLILSGVKETAEKIGGARILLVEPATVNREVVDQQLQRVGIEVEIAHTGVEALEKLDKSLMHTPFHAVLMDVGMADLDGYQTTHLIRSNPRFTHLPIIAMTAMKDEEDVCLKAGMNSQLIKPIRSERLYGILCQLIAPLTQPPDTLQTQEPTILSPIEGIDPVLGLERLGGDQNLFRRLLILFLKDQTDVVKTIQSNLEKGDLKTAQKVVNGLKNASGNIGALSLQQSADLLEKAILKGDKKEWIGSMKVFTETVQPLLDRLAQSIGGTPSNDSEEHAPLEKQIVTPLLNELETHILAFSLETEPLMILLAKQLSTTHVGPLFQQLGGDLDSYDFEEAIKTLYKLATRLEIPLEGKEP